MIVGLNLGASAAILWLSMTLAQLWFGLAAAWLTGLFLALWPVLIQFVTFPSSELFFTALLLAALLAWERQARPLPRGALSGLLLGLATLVRPVAMLVPVVLAGAELLRGTRRPLALLLSCLLALVVLAATLTPWSLRNHRVFGEVVLVSTNFGTNFWMGNNPDTDGRYMPLPEVRPFASEVERADYFLGEALSYVREDPVAFVRRTASKALYLLSRETIGVHWNRSEIERVFGTWAFDSLRILSTLYWEAMRALNVGPHPAPRWAAAQVRVLDRGTLANATEHSEPASPAISPTERQSAPPDPLPLPCRLDPGLVDPHLPRLVAVLEGRRQGGPEHQIALLRLGRHARARPRPVLEAVRCRPRCNGPRRPSRALRSSPRRPRPKPCASPILTFSSSLRRRPAGADATGSSSS